MEFEKSQNGKTKFISFILSFVLVFASITFIAQKGINAFAWNPDEQYLDEEYTLVYLTDQDMNGYLNENDPNNWSRIQSREIWYNIIKYAEEKNFSYKYCNDLLYADSEYEADTIIFDPEYNNGWSYEDFEPRLTMYFVSGQIRHIKNIIARGGIYEISEGRLQYTSVVPSAINAFYYLGFSYALQGFSDILIVTDDDPESNSNYKAMANGAQTAAALLNVQMNISVAYFYSNALTHNVGDWLSGVNKGVVSITVGDDFLSGTGESVFERVFEGYQERGYDPFSCIEMYPLVTFQKCRPNGERGPNGPYGPRSPVVINANYWLTDEEFLARILKEVHMEQPEDEFLIKFRKPPDYIIEPPPPWPHYPEPMVALNELYDRMAENGLIWEVYYDVGIEYLGITALNKESLNVYDEHYNSILTVALLTGTIKPYV